DNQPRFKSQAYNPLFADERADHPKVLGTVAQGRLEEDDHFYRGYRRTWNEQTQRFDFVFFDGFPERLKIDESFIRRGQAKYAIYCAPCHGLDGQGLGPVHVRVDGRQPTWVPPTVLTSEVPRQRELGHLFNTITVGIRNMGGYGHAIQVEDRWAIVAYMKTLQFAFSAPPTLVPAEIQNSMTVPAN
ncbi:MAG TPA: cytochrome c, partial [Tepidisphaeraceae bacterium]|nr:cytochrome c [Tepidisphaeraceae bacterium]